MSTMRAGGNAPGNDEVARAAKGQPRRVVEIEVAVDLAGQAPAVAEVQQLKVLDFVDHRWIVNCHLLVVAVIVGQA